MWPEGGSGGRGGVSESHSRVRQGKYHPALSWKPVLFSRLVGVERPGRDLWTTCRPADDRFLPHARPISARSVKGKLIPLLLSSKYNSPVTRSLIQQSFRGSPECQYEEIRQEADSSSSQRSIHSARLESAACSGLSRETWRPLILFWFHIHLDISVTTHTQRFLLIQGRFLPSVRLPEILLDA